jgi:hypothetical protein
MRSCRIVVAAAAALVVLWVPASALAQEPRATDPTPGSPSGTIYHLPVDTGRSDAAPHPVGKNGSTGGNTTSPDGEGTPGALYRSNNNFGTSSQVPGATSGGAAGKNGSESTATGGGSGGSDTTGADQPVSVAGAADTGEVSEPLTFGLLAGIIAAGAVLGLGLRRGRPNS